MSDDARTTGESSHADRAHDDVAMRHVAMRHVAMRDGAEFDAIRELLARWGPLAQGIGDDAAMLRVPDGRVLVASTDACIEDVHFRDGWLASREIGARAAAAALSDLAAMGASAHAVLVALAVPDRWRDQLGDLADGIGEVVARADARIVGGNVSRASALAITLTVLGHAERPVARSGARVGDLVLVSGTLGGPGAALAAWESGAEPSAWARERFASPAPRIALGQALADDVHAMLDVSDGLQADAAHLAAASGVAIRLDLGCIPVGPGIAPSSALVSGEEYELLLAAPPAVAARLVGDLPGRLGVPLTIVGEVLAREEGLPDVRVAGVDTAPRVDIAPGHDHFSR